MLESENNVSPNNTIELIRVLNNSVLALGVKKVISYLKWVTKMSGSDSKDIADLVIYSVCSKYRINFTSLTENNRNDGEYNNAVCLLAVLLKKHALMSQNEIAVKLKRHKSQVSKYITRMSQLNTELFKEDRKIHADFVEINSAIEKLIQNSQSEIWKLQTKNGEEGDHQNENPHQ